MPTFWTDGVGSKSTSRTNTIGSRRTGDGGCPGVVGAVVSITGVEDVYSVKTV